MRSAKRKEKQMKMKNDCERDYIKEAFIKLYNCVMPYIDLAQFDFDDARIAFNELENKVHSEIYFKHFIFNSTSCDYSTNY